MINKVHPLFLKEYFIYLCGFILLSNLFIHVFSCFRGFDFTDESYYLINYLYFDSIESVVSFFGFFFHQLFILIDGNIVIMRILAVFLLLGSTVFFVSRLFLFLDLVGYFRKYFFIVLSSANFGFYSKHLATLITPGYNLLSLVCLLLSTGIVFELICNVGKHSARLARIWAYFYGFVVAILILTKFSTGICIVAVHAFLALALVKRPWLVKINATLILFAAIGTGVVFMLLAIAVPDFAVKFKNGLIYISLLNDRDYLRELYRFITWSLQKAIIHSFAKGFGAGVFGFMLAITGVLYRRQWMLEFGLVVCMFALLLDIGYRGEAEIRVIRCAELLVLLGIVRYCRFRRDQQHIDWDWRFIATLSLLLVLPFVFSIGTNNYAFFHISLAVLFPLSAVSLLLLRFYQSGFIRSNILLVCGLLVALTPTDNLIRPWFDAGATYRLGNPLADENIWVDSLGVSLDQDTAAAVVRYEALLRDNRFPAGAPMLDFTGHSPGLVFVAKGRPLGTAWLLGEYIGVHAATDFVLGLIKVEDLKSAWLLSSEDDSLRIAAWPELLRKRIGEGAHWLPVGSVTFPQWQWNKLAIPEPATVTVWKPIN